jgi:pimeloyl-ACP methyl ester carboxylesterase
MGKQLETAIGVLNGAIGDYLVRTKNGLAIEMACYLRGERLPLDRVSIARAHPDARPRVAVLLHGLMCTESVWEFADGSDYGALLELDVGLTPLYVRYNSGVSIAENGAALSRLLASLVREYPRQLEEIVLIGYSMGGLVARSACHVAALTPAEHRWLPLVRRAIYVGTPHLGAPMERVGRLVARVLSAVDDPYTRLIADIADLRSNGVKDLGDADLRHEDRAAVLRRISLRDPRHPVPLLPSIAHYLIAGSLSIDARVAMLFGDAVVPVRSATDGGCIDAATLALPPSHVKLVRGADHLAIAHHPEVYTHVRAWCEEETP